VSCRISAKLKYGGWTINVDVNIELGLLTVFIGPNLSGKSLVACAIASALGGVRGRGCPPDVYSTCDVEQGRVLFLDAYRSVLYIEELIRKELERLEELAGDLKGHSDEWVSHSGYALERSLVGLRDMLRREPDLLLDIKRTTDDELLAEAGSIVREAVEEMRKYVEEMGLDVDVDSLLPIYISATDRGFIWRDPAGPQGSGLSRLPSSFSASILVTALKYSYATAREPMYLIVEEPEIHAHPLQAFFLGHLARAFVERAERRGLKLKFIATAHSIDFLRGVTGDRTLVYFMRRRVDHSNKTITIELKKWDRKDVAPGFPEAAALAIRRG